LVIKQSNKGGFKMNRLKRAGLVVAGLILMSTLVFALPSQKPDTLTWDAPTTNADGSPLTNLAGYKVYWKTVGNNYTNANSKDLGNVTTAKISISIGTSIPTRYYVVTAYNTGGKESAFSNEVSDFQEVPGVPGTLQISQ
jgi:hypothetical protein